MRDRGGNSASRRRSGWATARRPAAGASGPSILADATEALLGAIYLDGGIEPARAFVLRFIPHKVDVAIAGGAFKDYKTMLQEIVQKNKQETLEYRLAGQSGRITTSASPWNCCSTPMCLHPAPAGAKRKPSRWQPSRRSRPWAWNKEKSPGTKSRGIFMWQIKTSLFFRPGSGGWGRPHTGHRCGCCSRTP